MKKLKKLTFGTDKKVVIGNAICDYCQETKNICFEQVSTRSEMYFEKKFAHKYVIDNYKYKVNIFDFNYYYTRNTPIYTQVVVDEDFKTKTYPKTHICSDCIKEIYQFLKDN